MDSPGEFKGEGFLTKSSRGRRGALVKGPIKSVLKGLGQGDSPGGRF
jgi:hypothetical protein